MVNTTKPLVVIVHGWASTPKKGWIEWLRKKLADEHGYSVVAPAMPSPRRPDLEQWIATVMAACAGHKRIILVGHSLGTLTILHTILRLPADVHIEKIVLVSGFFVEPTAKYWTNYILSDKDFAQVIGRVGARYVLYSTNDRMVEPNLTARLARHIDAKLIPQVNMGHFTNLKVKTLPIVLDAVLEP